MMQLISMILQLLYLSPEVVSVSMFKEFSWSIPLRLDVHYATCVSWTNWWKKGTIHLSGVS
jgi:hypothetical protein